MAEGDDTLLEALRSLSPMYGFCDGWVSADDVRRHAYSGTPLGGPAASVVGRRLTQLARDGRCEMDYRDGAGVYRPA